MIYIKLPPTLLVARIKIVIIKVRKVVEIKEVLNLLKKGIVPQHPSPFSLFRYR